MWYVSEKNQMVVNCDLISIGECRIVAKLDASQSEIDALKRRPAESGQCPRPILDAWLPAILDRVFKGEL